MFEKQRIFLFDLDGTVYRGQRPIDGAAQVIQALRNAGRKCVFLSNNSTHSNDLLAEKLNKMGIPANIEDFITPFHYAGRFIREQYGMCRVFTLGTEALAREVEKSGHTLVGRSGPCDVVLVGRDLEIDYRKLETAGILLQKGAKLVACNTDLTHPGEEGFDVPETGVFLAALRCICPISYESIGKPAAYLFSLVGTPENIVMIGDNPLTDIVGGRKANCKTILISSKNSTDAADLVIDDIRKMMDYITIAKE